MDIFHNLIMETVSTKDLSEKYHDADVESSLSTEESTLLASPTTPNPRARTYRWRHFRTAFEAALVLILLGLFATNSVKFPGEIREMKTKKYGPTRELELIN
jgi:hypothetical protein